MNTELMFSSATDEWYTPLDFYKKLDKEFHFVLDPCSDDKNHKCEKYYTKEQDGLKQDWSWAGSVFMNPPYGRDIRHWIKKAYEESLKGATVVCLIPARTDTAYWHDYCMKGEMRFVRGRLKFGGCNNSAPFPSAVIIFGPNVTPCTCKAM